MSAHARNVTMESYKTKSIFSFLGYKDDKKMVISKGNVLVCLIALLVSVLVWIHIPSQYFSLEISPPKWNSLLELKEKLVDTAEVLSNVVEDRQPNDSKPIKSVHDWEATPSNVHSAVPIYPRAVLVYTEPRSGSKFFGDMFNHTIWNLG